MWVQPEHGKQVAVVDGRKQTRYDWIDVPGRQSFSPDSQHWTYLAKQGDKVFAVVGGKETELPYYDQSLWARRLAQRVSGEHIAYAAKKDGKRYWVVDGQAQKTYDEMSGYFLFSPDGRHFIYPARQGKKDTLVRDGQEIGTYDFVEEIAFSEDGKRSAFVAGKGERPKEPWYSIAMGVLETGAALVALDPNIRHKPIIVDKGKRHVVLDGQEGPPYDSITSLTFSSEGRRFAYKARRGREWVVVIDSREEPRVFNYVTRQPIRFSPDGKRVAYVGGRGNELVAVVDGSEMVFEDIVEGPIFSPDGQHVAIVPIEGHVYYVLLDGKRGKNYYAGVRQLLWPAAKPVSVVFSPNSQHSVYWAEDKPSFVGPSVVPTSALKPVGSVGWDAIEGKIWDQIPGRIVFDSDDPFHYFAAKAGRDGIDLYLVEERVP